MCPLSIGGTHPLKLIMLNVHINSFCSTHNEMFEAMDEKQETMVTTFMDTSLKYLHGASKDGLYIMVVRCLEVSMCVCSCACAYMVWCRGHVFTKGVFQQKTCYIPGHI